MQFPQEEPHVLERRLHVVPEDSNSAQQAHGYHFGGFELGREAQGLKEPRHHETERRDESRRRRSAHVVYRDSQVTTHVEEVTHDFAEVTVHGGENHWILDGIDVPERAQDAAPEYDAVLRSPTHSAPTGHHA